MNDTRFQARFAWMIAATAAGIILFGVPKAAVAQRAEPLPNELKGVGVTEHPGGRIPLDQ